MKNRLTKTLNRIQKNKNHEVDSENNQNKLSSYEIKVFRILREKYDLSLETNNNIKPDDKSLSIEVEKTLKRINDGEDFKP